MCDACAGPPGPPPTPSALLPAACTHRMPGMVRLVSATFVATMMVRGPAGDGANTLACSSDGSIAYSGSTRTGAAPLPPPPAALLAASPVAPATSALGGVRASGNSRSKRASASASSSAPITPSPSTSVASSSSSPLSFSAS
eukprot:64774-Chlamydomonas_euryale.AAC.2